MTGLRYMVIVPLLLLAGAASAAGTSIDLKGKVVATPCTVDTDTVDKEITLPGVQAHALADATSGGDWKDFSLVLTQCPGYMKSSTAKFSGTPDADDNTTYQNTGDAKNVSLQLSDKTTNYGNGSTMKVDVNETTHEADFPLSARIYSAKGGATKGTFASVVHVDFTYQ
jgi:minor fimbrial subunit